jgi:hypothetical protein
MSGVRQVCMRAAQARMTASLDLDLDGVPIDPQTVSAIRAVCGEDQDS